MVWGIENFVADSFSVVHCGVQIEFPPVFTPFVLEFRDFVHYAVYLVEDVVEFELEQVSGLGEDLRCGIAVVAEVLVAALVPDRVVLVRVASWLNAQFAVIKVKEECEKVGLKFNIQKTNIMASSPITSWQIDGETVETVREVAQSCPTLRNPMGCSLPGSSVHGDLQASILEWVAMPSFRGSSRD